MEKPTTEPKLRPKTRKGSCLEGVPELVTHREVARYFSVTPAGLRKWVHRGEFPAPHSIIAQTWFYRADWIAARLKTGRWPEGVRFRSVQR